MALSPTLSTKPTPPATAAADIHETKPVRDKETGLLLAMAHILQRLHPELDEFIKPFEDDKAPEGHDANTDATG